MLENYELRRDSQQTSLLSKALDVTESAIANNKQKVFLAEELVKNLENDIHDLEKEVKAKRDIFRRLREGFEKNYIETIKSLEEKTCQLDDYIDSNLKITQFVAELNELNSKIYKAYRVKQDQLFSSWFADLFGEDFDNFEKFEKFLFNKFFYNYVFKNMEESSKSLNELFLIYNNCVEEYKKFHGEFDELVIKFDVYYDRLVKLNSKLFKNSRHKLLYKKLAIDGNLNFFYQYISEAEKLASNLVSKQDKKNLEDCLQFMQKFKNFRGKNAVLFLKSVSS